PWARKHLRRGTLHDLIAEVCEGLKIRSLAIQPEAFTLADQAALAKRRPSLRLRPVPSLVADLRIEKSPAELRRIRKAIRVAEEAFEAAVAGIFIGQTERELAARLEYEMKLRGASDAAFPTICAEGPQAALPHAEPGDRPIRRGSAVLIDWGARVDGYCSDLTRMVWIGSIPREIRKVYPVVLEAQRRAIGAIRPGARMCDVDAVARDFIAQAGFGDAFGHGLGHGLGRNVHEAPSLSWRSRERLRPGMVVTVEPGIYLPGVGGVRIEDDVLVTPQGHRVLSKLGKAIDSFLVHRPASRAKSRRLGA
ncbi:MAG: M24 family metallopeptidase, partial [Planctomycetota bacterium]